MHFVANAVKFWYIISYITKPEQRTNSAKNGQIREAWPVRTAYDHDN